MSDGGDVVRLREPQSQSRPAASNSAPGAIPDGGAAWSLWKRWFDGWEAGAAQLAEQTLRRPWLLEPAGAVLTGALRMKALSDRVTDAWLGAMGLSTRTEQLRMRHEINVLHSRLLDLQERLEDAGGTP